LAEEDVGLMVSSRAPGKRRKTGGVPRGRKPVTTASSKRTSGTTTGNATPVDPSSC
jgi:hypothetical protein